MRAFQADKQSAQRARANIARAATKVRNAEARKAMVLAAQESWKRAQRALLDQEETERLVNAMATADCPWCMAEVRGDLIATGYVRPRGAGQTWRPCRCVRRRAFRAVMEEYHSFGPAVLGCAALTRATTWALPAAEFQADVEMTARKALTSEQWKMFEKRFLRGEFLRREKCGDYRLSEEVEAIMGERWMEIGIFPTSRYFAQGRSRTAVESGGRWDRQTQ
jgi:hypothetical protein